MPAEPAPLLLVDGHNLLWRSWFGFPARILARRDRARASHGRCPRCPADSPCTGAGDHVDVVTCERGGRRDLTGVFGFFALLRKAIGELPASARAPEVVVLFDGERAWDERLALDPAYKANRSADPAALAPIEALEDVRAGLDLLGIAHVEIPTAEADDLAASVIARDRTRTGAANRTRTRKADRARTGSANRTHAGTATRPAPEQRAASEPTRQPRDARPG